MRIGFIGLGHRAAAWREQHLAAIAHGFGEKDWTELGNWIAQCAGCER